MITDAVTRDLRFALRGISRAPLASAVIILCLALGVGVTSLVFAWVEELVLRPLPVVSGVDRLASIKSTTPRGEANLSYPAYRDVRDASRSFDGLAAYAIRQFGVQMTGAASDREAEPQWGVLTTANYFDLLGVRPLIGRGFLPQEGEVAGSGPVVVISHALWQTKFAGATDVLGRRIRVNGTELTIVGVAPPKFSGTITALVFSMWIPITMHDALTDGPLLETRSTRFLGVFGRLKPGVTLEQARAEAHGIGVRLAAAHEEDRERQLMARTLDTGPAQMMGSLFIVLLALTAVVLLLVCSNVANLMLLRAARREHELAVRTSLGATRARLLAQLLMESGLLAVGGVIMALVILISGKDLIMSIMPTTTLPGITETALDWRMIAFTVVIGLGTVVVFGVGPALRASRVTPRMALASSGRGATGAKSRLRGALVSAQFALATTALVSAGIFFQHLEAQRRIDRGFSTPEQVVVVPTNFTLAGYRGDSARRDVVDRLIHQLRTIPRVKSVAAASFVPLGVTGLSTVDTRVAGYTPRANEAMNFLSNRVTDGYFQTMGIPIVRGRPIDERDRADGVRVVVVNETFAKHFFGALDPVGRQVTVNGRDATIVGVARDGKYDFTALEQPTPPFVYLAFNQEGYYAVTLHVRAQCPASPTACDALALLPEIRRRILAVDARLPILSPSTLDDYSSVPFVAMRLGTTMLSILGITALVLAALGLYAVMSYAVAARQREIGIRTALGATPRQLVAALLIDGSRYVWIGAAAGVVLALLVSRGLAAALPEMGAPTVAIFAAAVGILGAVASISALVPSLRAASVDPTTALRAE